MLPIFQVPIPTQIDVKSYDELFWFVVVTGALLLWWIVRKVVVNQDRMTTLLTNHFAHDQENLEQIASNFTLNTAILREMKETLITDAIETRKALLEKVLEGKIEVKKKDDANTMTSRDTTTTTTTTSSSTSSPKEGS